MTESTKATRRRPLSIETRGDTSLVIVREFNGPRSLVFRAFVEPELVSKWMLGPDGWSLDIPRCDAVAGGEFRYVWKKEGVPDMGLNGTFLEVAPPERIVHTELFDQDWTGGESHITTTFTESGGMTTVEMVIRYKSSEARDGAMQSGMAAGMETGYERLDALLDSM